MREKYIDECVGILFIFGEYPDGHVDVANQRGDVFQAIPRGVAEQIELANAAYRKRLYAILEPLHYNYETQRWEIGEEQCKGS